MVSKASDDLPEPESPVKTTSLSRGIESVTFFRLCSRAPRIVMWSIGNPYLYLLSCYRKRSARGGDQLSVRPFDAALRHHSAPPCVDHMRFRAQCLADLGRGDEAELQVEAHGANYAWLKGTHGPAHGGVRQRADHPSVHKTGVVGHLFRGRHLDSGTTFACLHSPQPEPLPRSGRSRQFIHGHSRPSPPGTGMHVDEACATSLPCSSSTSASLKYSVCFISTTRPIARSRPSTTGRRKLIFSSIVVLHIPSSWSVPRVTPIAASAICVITPPCTIPPPWRCWGPTGSSNTTRPGSASTTRTPSSAIQPSGSAVSSCWARLKFFNSLSN